LAEGVHDWPVNGFGVSVITVRSSSMR